ncbi:hypothetical protein [Bacillus carboniphilus]
MHHEHENHHQMIKESDIHTFVAYKNGKINIELVDREGKDPELELTHEKLMHLIIVSEDLSEFYHVHPHQVGPSTFEKEIELNGNRYKVFVDINPKGKHYLIEPNEIQIHSSVQQYKDYPLEMDQQMTKEIKGKKVELQHDPFKVGKDIKLTFHLRNGTPQPYLGALGHVVIVDDKLEQFIHVHPASEKDTIFIAHFSHAGTYKMWAEFKFEEEVIAFPYVFNVV